MGLLEEPKRFERGGRTVRYYGRVGTITLTKKKTFTRTYEYAGAHTVIECEPQTVDIEVWSGFSSKYAVAKFEGKVVSDKFHARGPGFSKMVEPTEKGTETEYSIQWLDTYHIKEGEYRDDLIIELDDDVEILTVGEYGSGKPMTRLVKKGTEEEVF